MRIRNPHLANRKSLDDRQQTPVVVCLVVGADHHIEPSDAGPTQRLQHLPPGRASIHQPHPLGAFHKCGIPLTDIEEGDLLKHPLSLKAKHQGRHYCAP